MFGRHKDASLGSRARRRQRRAERRELRDERRLRATDPVRALGEAQAKGMNFGKSGLHK